jgi:hypothetical protein
VSVPARWARFALVAALAGWLAHRRLAGTAAGRLYGIWLAAWVAVYAVYFSLVRT